MNQEEDHKIVEIFHSEESTETKPNNENKNISSFWLVFADLAETLIVSIVIFLVVYFFLLQPNQIKGPSMLPNFHEGEYILTDKISYRFGQPKRGDVVIFKAPKNFRTEFIKRIIALPGEKIRLSNGEVFIYNNTYPQGFKLNEPYERTSPSSPGNFLKEGDTYALKNTEYFVMGDNRSQSSDSREWGTVPREDIIGKAWVKYWPINKLGITSQVKYNTF